jgi:hypothetical protein
MIDLERWKAEAAGPPSWDDRSRCIAGFIRAGESVLDIGAGARGLRAHLPSGCTYQAADCVPAPDVVEIDLEAVASETFAAGAFDVAVLAGVIEHLDSPGRAIELAATWARRTILTYAPRFDGKPSLEWRNHFALAELLELILTRGLSVSMLARWNGERVVMQVAR